MNLELDQTVWVKPIGNNARHGRKTDPIEATVCKIGRKYFEVVATDGSHLFSRSKFHLDSGLVESNYSAGYRVYETKQEIEDGRQRQVLSSKIHQFFSYNNKATLAQLLAVAEILGIEKELTEQAS
jgi:hypothetical protein